jgi:molecular chaperone GrpE
MQQPEKNPNEEANPAPETSAPTPESGTHAADAIPSEAADAVAAALDEAKNEANRWRESALRAQADVENNRRRMMRELEDARRYANADLLERLLPVLDNFDLGMMAARQSDPTSALVVGLEMVERQLIAFVKESGVEPVDSVGTQFDPNLHEAVGHEPSETVEEGVVMRQLRKGYKLRDRLLRPAMVVVSKGAEAATTASDL